jgi:hypothetical protein
MESFPAFQLRVPLVSWVVVAKKEGATGRSLAFPQRIRHLHHDTTIDLVVASSLFYRRSICIPCRQNVAVSPPSNCCHQHTATTKSGFWVTLLGLITISSVSIVVSSHIVPGEHHWRPTIRLPQPAYRNLDTSLLGIASNESTSFVPGIVEPDSTAPAERKIERFVFSFPTFPHLSHSFAFNSASLTGIEPARALP